MPMLGVSVSICEIPINKICTKGKVCEYVKEYKYIAICPLMVEMRSLSDVSYVF